MQTIQKPEVPNFVGLKSSRGVFDALLAEGAFDRIAEVNDEVNRDVARDQV